MNANVLPFEQGKDNTNLSLPEKLALFGPEAIPLIIPWGSKGQHVPGSPFNRYMKDWSRRTLKDTQDPYYQNDLLNCKCNVAIRQGGGLSRWCGWDFDTDESWVIREFFDANAFLKGPDQAIFTVGARGFTCWLLMKGPYPAQKVEVDVGGEKVEWRGNGYTLIHGLHPKGTMYRCFTFPKGFEL